MADTKQVTFTLPDLPHVAVSRAFYDSVSRPLWDDVADSHGNVTLSAYTAHRLYDRLEVMVVLSQLCCKQHDSDGSDAGMLLETREINGVTKALNLMAIDGLCEIANRLEYLMKAQEDEAQP